MQLEDYFTFLAADDIRLKGSRIGIETILYEYIYRARTAEEIAQIYPSLSIEQVYATILNVLLVYPTIKLIWMLALCVRYIHNRQSATRE